MVHLYGEDRKQVEIVCLDDLVCENSPARLIDLIVNKLDTSYFSNTVLKSTGRPPYNPKDLLKCFLLGLENSIMSSRRLERACKTDFEMRWLMRRLEPDHTTLSEFRRKNTDNLTKFFNVFTVYLYENGYIDGELLAIDGTKIRANNSKKNNYSSKKLDRLIKYNENRLQEYLLGLAKGDENDKKIEAVRGKIDTYKKYKERIDSGEVKEISTTDSDSRMMMTSNNGVAVCHNVQAAVDSKNGMVAGILIVSEPNDQGQLSKVAKVVKDNLGLEKTTVVADKGYYDTDDLKECHDEKIDTIVAKPNSKAQAEGIEFSRDDFVYDEDNDNYICPAGKILKFSCEDKNGIRRYNNLKACKNCPHRAKCTKGSRRDITRHKFAKNAEANDKNLLEKSHLYKLRQQLDEPVFGTIKRTIGLTQFLTNGNESVTAEAALAFTCFNLKRLRNILLDQPKNTPPNSQILPCFAALLPIFMLYLISICQNEKIKKS